MRVRKISGTRFVWIGQQSDLTRQQAFDLTACDDRSDLVGWVFDACLLLLERDALESPADSFHLLFRVATRDRKPSERRLVFRAGVEVYRLAPPVRAP